MRSTRNLGDLERWLRRRLPALNTSTEAGRTSPDEFKAALEPWTHRAVAEFLGKGNRLTVSEARLLLKLLVFAINSIERHFQAAGQPAGTGLKSLPRIEDLLLEVSSAAAHPPHGTVYTVWLWNRGEDPLLFTGDPQEHFFLRSVLLTDDLNAEACSVLRPIARGESPLGSMEALQAFDLAAVNLRKLQELYRSFMRADPDTGLPPITPEFFATRLRTYLPTYPVAGVSYSGGNAGDLASQIQLDFLVGTTRRDYEKKIIRQHRLPNLIPADGSAVEGDMASSSIFELFLARLGVTTDQLETTPDLRLPFHILGPDERTAAAKFGGLVEAMGDLSATHWALIQNFLVRLHRHVPKEVIEKKQLPTSTRKGTGGLEHAETKKIMEQRRLHPAREWRKIA